MATIKKKKQEKEIWKFHVAVASSRYRDHKLTCASSGKILAADRPRRIRPHSSSSRLRQLKLAPPPPQFSHNDGDSWEKAT